jgi:hypothetical protein
MEANADSMIAETTASGNLLTILLLGGILTLTLTLMFARDLFEKGEFEGQPFKNPFPSISCDTRLFKQSRKP